MELPGSGWRLGFWRGGGLWGVSEYEGGDCIRNSRMEREDGRMNR